MYVNFESDAGIIGVEKEYNGLFIPQHAKNSTKNYVKL